MRTYIRTYGTYTCIHTKESALHSEPHLLKAYRELTVGQAMHRHKFICNLLICILLHYRSKIEKEFLENPLIKNLGITIYGSVYEAKQKEIAERKVHCTCMYMYIL